MILARTYSENKFDDNLIIVVTLGVLPECKLRSIKPLRADASVEEIEFVRELEKLLINKED